MFSGVALVLALAFLRLSDRALIRVLGSASLMVAVPGMMLTGSMLNWRTELAGGSPTTIGYVLVTIACIGLIAMASGMLSAVLSLGVEGVRALCKLKSAKNSAKVLDKATQ